MYLRKDTYGGHAADVRKDLVCIAMRGDRFVQIIKFMHFTDNTKTPINDKMFMLRPLMDKLKEKCTKHFKVEQCLNYDECAIPYFGR